MGILNVIEKVIWTIIIKNKKLRVRIVLIVRDILGKCLLNMLRAPFTGRAEHDIWRRAHLRFFLNS
jgi:hypothetical protein